MLKIGCDYHPSVQQIALVDLRTGEYEEQRLNHSGGEAEKFYRDLKGRGCSVRVGIEAIGHSRWFERLLAELNLELWIGDSLQIKAMRVRKQKTDRQDAQLLLKLLLEEIKVSQHGDEPPVRDAVLSGMLFPIVRGKTCIPSLIRSSSAMRLSPQVELLAAISGIKFRRSNGSGGRPH
jgi:hypothetical protein